MPYNVLHKIQGDTGVVVGLFVTQSRPHAEAVISPSQVRRGRGQCRPIRGQRISILSNQWPA